MRGAPSDNSQSQHYHGESSTAAAAAATASGTSGTEEQIASDFEYAKRLQEMEDLSIEDDGMIWLQGLGISRCALCDVTSHNSGSSVGVGLILQISVACPLHQTLTMTMTITTKR